MLTILRLLEIFKLRCDRISILIVLHWDLEIRLRNILKITLLLLEWSLNLLGIKSCHLLLRLIHVYWKRWLCEIKGLSLIRIFVFFRLKSSLELTLKLLEISMILIVQSCYESLCSIELWCYLLVLERLKPLWFLP